MRRSIRFSHLIFLFTLISSLLSSASARPAKSKLDELAPYRRFIWVTRWDYRNAEDIEKICYNAASARFTDVLFQVRGEGTVFYRSSLEPWAWELTGSDASSTGVNPGWDPLATAIREGHRWGLRVHAYMNVLPGWAQKINPPRSSGQLIVKHPDWFMVDCDGDRMGSNWYRFLDPGLPEVRAHLSGLAGELARNYAIDGIHLDYIRYPYEKGDYSYCKPVVAQFRKIYGGSPGRNPSEWLEFRRAQVTETVRMISNAARKSRPGIEMSASVIADPDDSYQSCQQPELWLKKGLIDAAAPMAYTNDMDRFARLAGRFTQNGYAKNTWVGILADPDKNSHITSQIRMISRISIGGIAVFCYGDLFNDHRATTRARAVYETFVGGKRT
ncbi:family 10 glycosylhydrolase [bacterium]|nr:family 10 glycosylhydrolase [bacterium]